MLIDPNTIIGFSLIHIEHEVERLIQFESNCYTLPPRMCGVGGLFMKKMPMFQRAGMREGGLPLPPAFQYLIPIIYCIKSL